MLKKLGLCAILGIGFITGCASSRQSNDALEAGFANPPQEARPRTWWHWVSGNASKEGITADLEAMKRIGLAGPQMFTADQSSVKGKVLHMSPEWRALIQHAIKECDRLGLELTMHDCEGWSESGGPWITPELSMKKVVHSEQPVRGPGLQVLTLKQPETIKGYYKDIVIFAVPANITPKILDLANKVGMESRVLPDNADAAKVSLDQIIQLNQLIDLTDHVDPFGRLTWIAPSGNWTILRIGCTSTGKTNHPAMEQTQGLECDKMDPHAVEVNFNGQMGAVIHDSPDLVGKSLRMVLMDSWEAGRENWTPGFRDEFAKRRGYDPTPWLPALTGRYVQSSDATERFLWDFRKTIAELIAENHYGTMRNLLHDNHLLLTAEAPGIGLPVCADELQCKGQTDVPMGEFWVGEHHDADTKEAASAAHIYGRQFAAAESFTARPDRAGWTNDPYSLKALGDWQFALGINRFVFHRYAHQPWLDRSPGMTMGPWGINFERTNTWWEPGKAWITYISRCQYLLSRGQFVADLLFYYGEGAARDYQPSRLKPAPPAGYDWDACNAEILFQAHVENGRIVLPSGMSYRVLVLPDYTAMTPQVAEKVQDLVRAGACIVGPKPTASPSLADYPNCDAQVKQIAQQVWADKLPHTYGKGKVIPAATLEKELGQKDFDSQGTPTHWIHRRTDSGVDIYFVANPRDHYVKSLCTFRVIGKTPEFWHPDTGQIEPAAVYWEKDGRTTLPISFDPAASVFVLFRKPASGAQPKTDSIASITHDGQSIFERPEHPTGELKILSATYGVLNGQPDQQIPCTDHIASAVHNGTTSVIVSNELCGKDPAKNLHKQLRVTYSFKGEDHTLTIDEGNTLELPDTGDEVASVEAVATTGANEIKFRLWKEGSYEVKTTAGRHFKLVGTEPSRTTIEGPWQLHFPPKWGAPATATFDQLQSWTKSDTDGIKYFSGTAAYTKTIDIPKESLVPGNDLFLDLGSVKNLAQVKLNGHDLGILWKPPFRANLTGVAHPGSNQLEIQVTNLWPNRLIGDQKLPEDKRLTWAAYSPYTKDSPLLDSGLLGPVTLIALHPETIQLPAKK